MSLVLNSETQSALLKDKEQNLRENCFIFQFTNNPLKDISLFNKMCQNITSD